MKYFLVNCLIILFINNSCIVNCYNIIPDFNICNNFHHEDRHFCGQFLIASQRKNLNITDLNRYDRARRVIIKYDCNLFVYLLIFFFQLCMDLYMDNIEDLNRANLNVPVHNNCKLCRTVLDKMYDAFYCQKFMFKVQLAVHTCSRNDDICHKFVKMNFQRITDLFFPSIDSACKKIDACD